MNWKKRLFKPKWQHKNADIRLAAVSTEQAPEFLQQLVEIAAGDTDSRVRCAAIKRLHKLENILKLSSLEKDQEAQALLHARIRQLTTSSAADRPPLALRLQVLQGSDDRDLIEHLASNAVETELRRAAIAKVKRQGLLGDYAMADEDSENRQLAASLITQHTTLKRVIDGLRTRDKQLYAQLQERLHEESIALFDPQAINAEALKICTALEHYAIDPAADHDAEIAAQHLAWKRVTEHVTADMQLRYRRVSERLANPPRAAVEIESSQPAPESHDTSSVESVDQKHTEAVEDEIVAEAVPSQELAKVATDIMLYDADNAQQPNAKRISAFRSKLDAALQRSEPAHADDLSAFQQADKALREMMLQVEKQRALAEKEVSEAEKHLKTLVTALEVGELHNALASQSTLRQMHKDRTAGHDHAWKRITSQLANQKGRINELREWQHWSNNKVRQRLISDMEALPAADLHPDALLESVKSLQAEWKALEISEQIPAEKHFSPAPWMWRKFSAAGHAAFDTIKPFLDKRSEIQSRHAQSLATFCAELEQLADATPTDWTALGKAITRGRKKLHDLNNIPARQRQKLAKQLKAALDAGNKVIQDQYDQVEKEKMKLIRSASQLVHLPERSDAIAQAKSLQSAWKDAGSLWRSKEQELWNQFREHLDPLFDELKQQHASEKAADQEKLAAQKALCAEMKDILASADDLASQHGKVQGLRNSWKDIEYPDRKLLADFQAMLEEFQAREVKAEQKLLDAKHDRLWVKSALLHELAVSGRTASGSLSKKTETRVKKDWPEGTSTGPFETSLDNACESILSGTAVETTAAETSKRLDDARLLSIRLEFLAGLESPANEQAQRMQYQVDRLAQSMSGDVTRQSAEEEARELEKSWLAMYLLPEAEFKSFGARIKKALKKITGE